MALVKCPECKGDVSDRALACPHCGFPLKQEDEYVLTKGSEEKSSFATFLQILAWICWIGGLIIAISGAQILDSYSSRHTVFSFGTFLTLFLPYLIDGVIVMCMATIVNHISCTYSIVSGLSLGKKKTNIAKNSNTYDLPGKPVHQLESSQTGPSNSSGISSQTEKAEDSSPPENRDKSWISDGSKFTICPQCKYRMTYDFIKARKKCPKCGQPYNPEE